MYRMYIVSVNAILCTNMPILLCIREWQHSWKSEIQSLPISRTKESIYRTYLNSDTLREDEYSRNRNHALLLRHDKHRLFVSGCALQAPINHEWRMDFSSTKLLQSC
jgi:hypothetical protein